MKKIRSSPKKSTKKITLEGTFKTFLMLDPIDPEDWKMGNIGIVHSLESYYDETYSFLVGENGIPIYFEGRIPLSFTERITNASSFYTSTQGDNFYVEIGPEDDWVIEKYGKKLPNNVFFEMFDGEYKRTVFSTDLPYQSFQYPFKRMLSYEEIMSLSRYFKNPEKGYFYKFKFTYPYSKENNYVYEMHSDGTISSNLPKGWTMGIYKIFKENNKIKGIVDYFGTKGNKKKALNVIESMYEDVEDISFREGYQLSDFFQKN